MPNVKLFSAPALALVVGALAIASQAQQPPPAQPIATMPVRDNIYLVTGGAGSNSSFIVGDKGVIVVDAKMTEDSGKGVVAEIAKATPKPVTTVILTHSDADHVNGLVGFPKGLTIIAQENCKAEMEKSLSSPQMPAPADYMPTKTVDKKENVTIDGVKLELLHWAPAHTSGDLVVYAPAQRVVFTGDIISAGMPYTLIHLEKHGSSEGWIETVKGILALDADTFVPGHGPLQTRDDVQKRLDSVIQRRDQIKALVAQGKSLDEVKQALGESTAPPAPGGRGPRFPSFTETVYKELTTKS